MILYFLNRTMEILGHASTNLRKGIIISDDLKTEDVESGVASFSCTVGFNKKYRKKLETMIEPGNYILRKNLNENEFYTILDSDLDSKDGTAYIYAEDAGLDLINEIAESFEAKEAHPATWYIEKWITDSGFEIGINEIPGTHERLLKWESESTVTERLASIATQFGNYEISFSFKIKGMEIKRKLVNFHVQRGEDNHAQLRLNRDIDRIVVKKSIANLATALKCTGGVPEDSEEPITLKGYVYDDGDFYVDEEGTLCSRQAVKKWSRYIWNKEPNRLDGYHGHIKRTYSYDTTEQSTLLAHSLTKLKSICDLEVNYEVDVSKLPDGTKIGDRVDIVDDAGELYISSRIVKLETSVSSKNQIATIGEHVIKDGGISQRVEELAQQFSEIAKGRTFYTWIAYADDEFGNGISLDPAGKDYLGTSTNRLIEKVDISDPTIFTWSKIKGENGASGTGILKLTEQYYLSSSNEALVNGSWSDATVGWKNGYYIWIRNKIEWSDGTTSYTTSALDKASNDANEKSYAAKTQAENAVKVSDAAKKSAKNAQDTAETVKTEVDGLKVRVEDTEATLELKVDVETLVSEINASADVITLVGNRFIVNSDNLQITEDGTITATNGIFTGMIKGSSGEFTEGFYVNLDMGLNDGSSFTMEMNTNEETGIKNFFVGYTGNEEYSQAGLTVSPSEVTLYGFSVELSANRGLAISSMMQIDLISPSIYFDGGWTDTCELGFNSKPILSLYNHDMTVTDGVRSYELLETLNELTSSKVLWSGGYYMSADHTVTLLEAISEQPNGVVLVFSEYVEGAPKDQAFHHVFIPKHQVSAHNGCSEIIQMSTGNLAYFATKTLYIYDDKIVGSNNNIASGTGTSGIKYTNNRFVLRHVIGI